MSQDKRDRELGMERRITRRDFLNGVAVGIGECWDGSELGMTQLRSSPRERIRRRDSIRRLSRI